MPGRILIVDDTRFSRKAVRKTLEEELGLVMIWEAEDLIEAVLKSKEVVPDYVIINSNLGENDDVSNSERIKELLPNIEVLTYLSGQERKICKILQEKFNFKS